MASYPAVCGQCMQFIDLKAVVESLRRGERFVHPCGRVLVWEKEKLT